MTVKHKSTVLQVPETDCCSHSHQKPDAPPARETGHSHGTEAASGYGAFRVYLPAAVSAVLLGIGLLMDQWIHPAFFSGMVRPAWYLAAYLPVGWPVVREAAGALRGGSVFNEFTLMVLATLGAFALGEYPEGVAVMLFYSVGELFQGAAVRRAKSNIKALLDVRPKSVLLKRNGRFANASPESVRIGDVVQVLAGQQVPLDARLLSEEGTFNTAALSGESRPKRLVRDDTVLAGMLNEGKVAEMEVLRLYEDSALARILDMVQNAAARKARTELLIRKFAKVYTPVVFFLAVALVAIPYFVVPDYVFRDWLYRALVFLVISCPCALVISIPLGYFGGIGAASRHGILFKGANFLDLITRVGSVVMDKTGTLTKGVFRVQSVFLTGEGKRALNESQFVDTLAALEKNSTHPVARAVVAHVNTDLVAFGVSDIREFSGMGLKGTVRHPRLFPDGTEVLAGNAKLLDKMGVSYDPNVETIVETVVLVALDGKYAGYVLVADEPKEDAADAVRKLQENGIRTVMLSGDKPSIVVKTGRDLGVDKAVGGLLPEGKVAELNALKTAGDGKPVAFVGDGINDAPVLALSDVGIAMGGMGSDVAIESADVVIQTDQPSRIATAIAIGKATKKVVIQNIVLAFAVKAIVLALGAGGVATMWEAVFADVGVALLAILNAVRIQRMSFE